MRPLGLILLLLAETPLFSKGRAPVVTGAEAPVLSAQSCRVCHERAYSEWSGSRHAQAWSNALLLSGQEPSAAACQAHPIRHEPQLREVDFCGGCHEFHRPDFTKPGQPDMPLLMQKTVTEWRASEAASQGQTCQSCHMAGGGHQFPGAHDAEFVRGALEIQWRWQERSQVCAVLRTRGVGHSVPSGDPFRRLRLRVCQEVSCKPPAGQRLLKRWFSSTGEQLSESGDTRLPAPSAAAAPVCFEFLRGATLPSFWTLELLYAETSTEPHLPDSAKRVLLMAGELPSLGTPPRCGAPNACGSVPRER